MAKPSANHPWRKVISSEQHKWAKEQSHVTSPNNIVAADISKAERRPKDKRGAV